MEDGHRFQRSLRTGSRSEAKRALADMLAGEAAPSPSGTPCVEYALAWVDGRLALGAIEESTARHYRNDVASWLPWLPMPLRDVGRRDVERGVRGMLAAGRVASTVNRRYSIMQAVFRDAVALGDAPANPFDGVPRPRGARRDHNCLTAEERSMVREYVASSCSRLAVAVALAVWAGLRCQEVCGLKASDVDLGAGTGWVRRSIGIRDGGSYVKPSKSGRARDFPVPAPLADALSRWLASPQRDGGEWLVGLSGHWCDPSYISRRWAAWADAMGLRGTLGKRPTFHDLRHTYATVAIAAGVDVKTVSSVLGHASAAMTLDVYAVADPVAKRHSASVMADAI